MGAARDPFERILAIPSVRASYVLTRTGDVVAKRERGGPGEPQDLDRLGKLAKEMIGTGQEIAELALFYAKTLVLIRAVGPRVVVLISAPETALSLLRVTMDVVGHEWSAQGMERLFPWKKGSEEGAGRWGRLFGKR
jgi:hypothetical protein